jgi:chromosome segregation ATPase
MENLFMPDATPAERLQALRNHADKIEENASYERELSEEEIDAKRAEYVDNDNTVDILESELNAYKKAYKGKIEPIKTTNKGLRFEVRSKRKKEKGTLYHLANQDTGFMETYNEVGEFIGRRRLRPDERQTRLYIPPAAANQ